MEKYTRKKNQFNPMSKEEFMKKEIERQREIEGDKKFQKFRVVTYEQKKSGGYPFSDFQTDNFYEAVLFGKQRMQEQKNYRPDSEYLWVSISEFQPIHERSNVIYPYKSMVHFGEDDIEDSKFAKGGGVDVKKGAIKVGVFSLEDLKTDVFEKAFNKKSKETGLTNTDLKTINKGGKTFIELYLIPNKSDSDVKIKDWYMKNYPTDDLGEELNDEVTFEDMWNEDYEKYNIYQVMGVGDSVIRERLFEHLAEIKGVSYDVVYKKMFLTGNYANGGGVGQVEHFTLDKDKLNEDAKWYADRIKSGQMSTTKKSIEERIEEYKKDLFLLEIGRKKPSNIIGTGYKGNAKKMANTWLLQEIYKDTKILELLGDNYSNGGGVGLIGNQKRIDMNHNGKIDAEDFKLLRSSMNGAWRKEHKYVNSTSRKDGKVIDYEVRYARKNNPSRKGYKGKTFADGGAVNLDFKNFTLNELSKSLPEDVSIMWLFQKKPEKFIRIHDKEWNKYASKHWTITDYGQLELSKGSENLYLDLKVYEASEEAPEVEYFVTIYTKDNHNGLKEFSKNLVQKFNNGGLFDERDNQGMIYALQEHISSGEIANMTDLSTYDSIAESRSKAIEYYVKYGDKPYSMTELKNVLSIVSTPLYHKYRSKFATGGGFERLSNSVAKRYEGDAVAPKYQRLYGKRYDKEEAKEVGNKVAGKVKAMQMQNKKAFGGLFGSSAIKPTPKLNLDEKQVMLKNGEWVQVLDQSGDTLMVMDLRKLGTGAEPKRVKLSDVDMNSFMAGGKVANKKPSVAKKTTDKRGGAMQLAKEIRKVGEKWTDAVKRASQQLKK